MKNAVMKKFRRLLALVMALVMISSTLPVAYAETTDCLEGCTEGAHAEDCPNAVAEDEADEEQTPSEDASEGSSEDEIQQQSEEEKKLFAVWSHGGDPMYSWELATDSSSPLVFRYGTSLADSVPVCLSELTVTAPATISLDTGFSSDYGEVVRVGVSGLGTGSIGYTGDSGVSFCVTGLLYSGEGPRLVAKDSSGNYMTSLWIHDTQTPITATFYLAGDPSDLSQCAAVDPAQLTSSTESVGLFWNEDGTVNVFAETNGTIAYGEYTMDVYYTGSSGGDSGESGDNSGSECTETEDHLFAIDPNGYNHIHQDGYQLDSGAPKLFCFGTAESYQILPLSVLNTTGAAVLSEDTWTTDEQGNLIPNLLILGVSKAGEGAVTYTVDGTTYTFPVTGSLRSYACYTAPERTGENYTSVFTANEDNNVVLYILWEETMPAPTGVTATMYEQDGDPELECVLQTEFADSYIKVTFPMPTYNVVKLYLTANGNTLETIWLWNGNNMGGGDGGNGGSGSPSIDCTDTEAHLFATEIDGNCHYHESNIQIDSGFPVAFRFGTASESVEIPLSELSATGCATINEMTMPGEGDTTISCIALGVNNVGAGSVTYTVDGVTYAYTVNGLLRTYSCYTAPERTGENYTSMFNAGKDGNVELYILWEETMPAPTGVTATMYEQDGDPELECALQTEFADSYIKVTFPMPSYNVVKLYLTADGNTLETIWLWNGNNVGGNPDCWTVEVDHNGIPVTVGIGTNMGEQLSIITGSFGDSYNPDYPRDYAFNFYFAALSNYGDQTLEAAAPASFFEAVSDVSFYVKSYTNTDGSSQDIPNASFTEVTTGQHGGVNTWVTTLQAEEKKFFEAVIAMQFTYQDTVYEVSIEGFYNYSGDIALDASDLDTAEELNSVLSNSDALLNWFEQTHPETFASFGGDGMGTISLELPAVTYTDVIRVSGCRATGSEREKSFYGVELVGTTDEAGNQTTLPGVEAKGYVSGIRNINFVAQPGKTMTYNGETFTCGILVNADGMDTVQDFVDAEVCWIQGCTFRGFDYGIRSTTGGFAGSTSSCKFIENGYGYYMDCQGETTGGNTSYTHNTFINNGCAVAIKSLPSNATAYRVRFTDSAFIHNGWDFYVPIHARFYFYRNWYGHYPAMPRSADSVDYETMTAESRSALIDDAEDTATVVSNPRRMYQDEVVLGIDNAEGLHSMILNNEAASLTVSGEALEALTGSADISVLNEQEEEIGIWTFEGDE